MVFHLIPLHVQKSLLHSPQYDADTAPVAPIRNAGEKRDEAPQTYGKLYLGAKRDAAENEAVPTIYSEQHT